jgi:hypothetical protein
MPSPLALDVGVVPELEESPDRTVGPHDHASAVASITAVGSSLGLERLVVKRGRAVAARPRAHVDLDLVDESHDYLPISKGAAGGLVGGFAGSSRSIERLRDSKTGIEGAKLELGRAW